MKDLSACIPTVLTTEQKCMEAKPQSEGVLHTSYRINKTKNQSGTLSGKENRVCTVHDGKWICGTF